MNTIARAVHETRDFLRENGLIVFLLPVSLLVGYLIVLGPLPDYVILLAVVALPFLLLVQFAVIRDLAIGIVIYLVLEYLQPGHRIHVIRAIRPALLISGAIMVGWVINLIRHRVPLVLNWQVKSYLLLLLIGSFSAFNAISIGMAAENLITLAKTFAVFTVMFSAIRSFDQFRQLTWVYILLHVLLGIGAFALFATGGERRMGDLGGSFLGDENDSAMAVLIMIPYMVFMLSVTHRTRTRLILYAGILFCSLAVLFSFSRGAFLGFLTMVLYFVAKAKGRRKLRAIFLLVLAAVVLLAVMPQQYWERIESMTGYATEGSAQGRLDAWKGGVQMMIDSPLFGCGLGNFARTYGTRYNTLNTRWTAAHSLYIQFIGELGVPGLLFIVFYIYLTFRTLHRARRIVRQLDTQEGLVLEKILLGVEGGFLSYLVCTAFLNSLHYPHLWHFGAMAGLGLISARKLLSTARPRLGQVSAAPEIP